MSSWYRRAPDGTLSVAVHAQPGAKRTELAGLHGEALKIRIAAPAQDDRANDALVHFLAALFEVPRRAVRLASGARSRAKRFEIRGSRVDPEKMGSDPISGRKNGG